MIGQSENKCSPDSDMVETGVFSRSAFGEGPDTLNALGFGEGPDTFNAVGFGEGPNTLNALAFGEGNVQ